MKHCRLIGGLALLINGGVLLFCRKIDKELVCKSKASTMVD